MNPVDALRAPTIISRPDDPAYWEVLRLLEQHPRISMEPLELSSLAQHIANTIRGVDSGAL